MAARKKTTDRTTGSRKKATRKTSPAKKATKRARAMSAAMEIVDAALETGAGLAERRMNGGSKHAARNDGSENHNGKRKRTARKSTSRKTTRKTRSR